MAIAIATMYEDVYDAIRTILVANKPTYTYNEVEYTYDILAEYHNKDAAFPQIVLNKAMININMITMDGSGQDYMIEVQMDLYAKDAHGKGAIDQALSQLMATFLSAQASLKSDNSMVTQDDFWEVSSSDVFDDKNQTLNTVSAIMRFKYK